MVRDDDEAGSLRGEVVDEAAHPVHVGVVERGVNLVEDADRRGADQEDREDEGQCHEGLLTA
ncbi:hypothetical protein D3C71_2156150 [compost metagenome]